MTHMINRKKRDKRINVYETFLVIVLIDFWKYLLQLSILTIRHNSHVFIFFLQVLTIFLKDYDHIFSRLIVYKYRVFLFAVYFDIQLKVSRFLDCNRETLSLA